MSDHDRERFFKVTSTPYDPLSHLGAAEHAGQRVGRLLSCVSAWALFLSDAGAADQLQERQRQRCQIRELESIVRDLSEMPAQENDTASEV